MIRATVSTLLASLLLAGCGAAYGPLAAPRAMGGADALKLAAKVQAENFKKVSDELYRSGVPSDDDLAAMKAMGIKTDITLQSLGGKEAGVVDHEKSVCKKLGIKVVHLPLPWAKEPPKSMIDKYLKVFEEPDNLPALVHCKRGRDRTGAMVAIYRIVRSEWTNEKAFKEMESFGFKKEDYPYFHTFVMEYGKAVDEKKKARKQREEALAAFAPGSWDLE